MNKFRIIAAISAAVMAASMAGCNKSSGGRSYSSNEAPSTIPVPPTLPPTPISGIEAASDGPRLYMKDVTAHPGETVELTMAVENADMKWNMCGIHITYPDFLVCKLRDEKEGFCKYKLGAASDYNSGSVGMIWREGLPEELVKNNEGCVFFTTMFDGDIGGEGDIVSFEFEVPMDAKKGEYPLGFYYRETDRFTNMADDMAMEQYVFQNWRTGTLTIE